MYNSVNPFVALSNHTILPVTHESMTRLGRTPLHSPPIPPLALSIKDRADSRNAGILSVPAAHPRILFQNPSNHSPRFFRHQVPLHGFSAAPLDPTLWTAGALDTNPRTCSRTAVVPRAAWRVGQAARDLAGFCLCRDAIGAWIGNWAKFHRQLGSRACSGLGGS